VAGPLGQLAQALFVDSIAGGRADPVAADDAEGDALVLDQRRLMDLGACEAGKAGQLGLDDRLCGVAVGSGDRLLRQFERPGHDGATPTCTFLNRAAAAP
jgi:hypothetical protein